MAYEWHDFLGNLGVLAILGCYLLLQLDKLKSDDIRFSLLNGLGALLVLISLIYEFNFSAFLIEFFWLLISVIGLYRSWAVRRGSALEQSG